MTNTYRSLQITIESKDGSRIPRERSYRYPGRVLNRYWVTIRKTRDISKHRRRVLVAEIRAAHDPT